VLSRDRREKLDACGFVWNSNDLAWDERYRQLLTWTNEHGHACVPIADGDLGLWVAKQRQQKRKGKLAADRQSLLDAANFTWDTPSAEWNERFNSLVNWKEDTGDCRVPFNCASGLGWWVNTQRQARRKGKMSDERIERLDSIGFIWTPQEISRGGTSSSVAGSTSGQASAGNASPGASLTEGSNSLASGPVSNMLGSAATTDDTMPISRIQRPPAKRKNDDRPPPAVVSASGLPIAPMTKRHSSFGGYVTGASSFGFDDSSGPLSLLHNHGVQRGDAVWAPPTNTRRASSFGIFSPSLPSLPSTPTTHRSGASTPTGMYGSGTATLGGLNSTMNDSSAVLPPLHYPPGMSGAMSGHLHPPSSSLSSSPLLMSPRQLSASASCTSQPSGSASVLPFTPMPPIVNVVRAASPRRRGRLPFPYPDNRRALSFPELLNSAFNPALTLSLPVSPAVSSPIAHHTEAASTLHSKSKSIDSMLTSNPLQDLANLAVSSASQPASPLVLPCAVANAPPQPSRRQVHHEIHDAQLLPRQSQTEPQAFEPQVVVAVVHHRAEQRWSPEQPVGPLPGSIQAILD
jgi:hypothetical protein